MSQPIKLPKWVDIGVIPALNILAALAVSALVILALGENPADALEVMLYGAFGYDEAIGYTLYYTTNFIFTGLAVAVAFHAGLFNIGGEGQAYIGGLGVGLVILALDGLRPGTGTRCAGHDRGWAFRRNLGGGAGLAAGLSRQSHCHHDHHV